VREGGLELLTPHKQLGTTSDLTCTKSTFGNHTKRYPAPAATLISIFGSTKHCTNSQGLSKFSALSQTALDGFGYIETRHFLSRTCSKLLTKAIGPRALFEGLITDAK
jgi:hypothetical protein